MKVKELIAKLEQEDPELEVWAKDDNTYDPENHVVENSEHRFANPDNDDFFQNRRSIEYYWNNTTDQQRIKRPDLNPNNFTLEAIFL